jgi:hypothetical protein
MDDIKLGADKLRSVMDRVAITDTPFEQDCEARQVDADELFEILIEMKDAMLVHVIGEEDPDYFISALYMAWEYGFQCAAEIEMQRIAAGEGAT